MNFGTDLTAQVGSVTLPNPVMTASGTAGHGAEMRRYVDLAELGAVVVKSLSVRPWPGNAAPRLVQTPTGMLNSVGLQGPAIEAWLRHELPPLIDTGARVVASIWGQSVADYARAADMLATAPAQVVAVEVNVSCPNIEDRRRMFAHSPEATAEVMGATAACGRPRWAKLSPNVTDLVEVAGAALEAGAEALTLINTVMGLAIDTETGAARLGGGGGGISGPAIHPVAVRAVYECRAAFPGAPIVGVGGISNATDAVELAMAGANAVQVGTANFADPRATVRILARIDKWCRAHGVARWAELIGGAHDS
ncbi:MAG: dihydroorotate dehydrogenase [Acidimicrobiales bacterium]